MSKKVKLIQRFKSKPLDFTWRELVTLLNSLGFELISGGKTSGSRIKFIHNKYPIIFIHKPHPHPVLKPYQIELIYEYLVREALYD